MKVLLLVILFACYGERSRDRRGNLPKIWDLFSGRVIRYAKKKKRFKRVEGKVNTFDLLR